MALENPPSDPDEKGNRIGMLSQSGAVVQSLLRNDPDRLFLFGHPLDPPRFKKAIVEHEYPHELDIDFVKPLRRLVASVTDILGDSKTEPLVENAAELAGRMQVGVGKRFAR